MGKILILDGQQRNVLSCVRSMGKAGHEVTVGSHKRDALCFGSRFAKKRFLYTDPAVKPEMFNQELVNHIKKNSYELVLPFIDSTTESMVKNQDIIKRFAPLLLPPRNAFELAFDKAETFKLAKLLNIPIPATWFPASLKEASETAKNIEYPLIIKPRKSSGSRGLKIAKNFQDFKKKYAKTDEEYPNPIIQEFIPLKEAVGFVSLYGRDNTLKAYCQHRRLHEYPLTGGPSTLRETILDDRLTVFGTRLLDELSWQGPAMVEFRVDARDNIPKLMEINPRLWGSIALHIAAGINFPELIRMEAQGEKYDAVFFYKVGTRAKWFLPGELLYFLANLRHGKICLDALKWRGDNQVLDILSSDDPMPAWVMMKNLFKSVFNLKTLKHSIFR